ncbi:MAG: glycosyltransferase [Nanoarchaeota archaeon]
MSYSIKDISVIIATYNRAKDLNKAIESFKDKINSIGELIIVDQSTDDSTKKVVKSFRSKKIRYYHSNKPSLTAARNTGIEKLSKNSKVAVFIDDDVTLDKNYFNEILNVFNKYPNAKGAGGYFLPRIKINKFENLLKKLFFIEHYKKNNANVHSVYGAVYPSKLTKIIQADWIPGFNMAYKTEIFAKEIFDSKLVKYALAEDFDFSTRVNKRWINSLYITPHAKIIHHVSNIERTPTVKLSYMNQINHIYIHFKTFDSFFNNLILLWTLMGILFLRTIKLLASRKMVELTKTKLYLKSLTYTYNNLHLIKKGRLDLVYRSLFN